MGVKLKENCGNCHVSVGSFIEIFLLRHLGCREIKSFLGGM